MSIRGKHWKLALIVIGAIAALQLTASAVVRSERVKAYLLAHLERTFGRRVEVREFTVSLLPSPQLDAAEISVSEDPAFGNEYFLRADRLSAGLRWFGLLRGRFEFGTVSLTRPSLTLVRNQEGRWNLEQWLPPGRPGAGSSSNAPAQAAEVANHLEKIDIDEGRVSFKLGDDKQAFAFVEVSGNVRQAAPGRWELQLQAEPWRSGVQLQSAGTIHVQGEVAGTSSRLQPAQLQIRWGGASLADVLRLLHGQDTGVRGSFALDAVAESGMPQNAALPAGQWSFGIEARAGQIHRWDLTERGDNPQVSLRAKGHWNPAAGSFTADEMAIEAPESNLRGTVLLLTKPRTSFAVHVDSAGIQAADLLAWCRAFQPGISEQVKASQYFTGAMTLTGWPLSLEAAAFSSRGGTISVPGLQAALHVGPVRGGVERREFVVEPATISILPTGPAPRAKTAAARPGITVSLTGDLDQHSGAILFAGRGTRVEDALKVSAALGHTLNFGWEMTGEASTALRWRWSALESPVWDGSIDFSRSKLQVAGLNQTLALDDARLGWNSGKKFIQLTKAEGFGAEWNGRIARADPVDLQEGIQWDFDLHADRLDAAELDRWIGPRARPSWVRRLLSSLLGTSQPSVSASELLRRASARGVLRADEFDLEKFRFRQLRAEGDLQNLHLTLRQADAQWAGGTLQAKMIAEFSPQPKYEIAAQFDRVNLAQIPLAGKIAERVAGTASGAIQLKTGGVGREVLLQKLNGDGKFQLHRIEFRGWDVAASLTTGSPRSGASRWTSGDGAFHIAGESFELDALRLSAPREEVLLRGSVSFQREADLTLRAVDQTQRRSRLAAARHVLSIAGPLDAPKVSLLARVAQQPGD